MAISARAILDAFLRDMGLEQLGDWAWSTYIAYGGGDVGIAAVENELPNRPEFNSRFPAYRSLAARGRAMSVGEMLAYERAAVQIMRSAGLPGWFYDSPDDLHRLIENEVSVAELQQRVMLARDAVERRKAEPEFAAALERFYGEGGDDGALLATILDPERALPQVERQLTAARFGASARQSGVDLGVETAERLAVAGVDVNQFRQALPTVVSLSTAVAGEAENLGADLAAEGVVGTNPNAARRVRETARRRRAEFAGSSGFGVSESGVAGLAESS